MTTLKIKVKDISAVATLLREEKVWHMPFRYNLGHYEVTLKNSDPIVTLLQLKFSNT